MVLLDPLLLESQSLVLQSLLSLEVDLGLGQLVHRLVVLELKVLNFGGQSGFLSLDFLPLII